MHVAHVKIIALTSSLVFFGNHTYLSRYLRNDTYFFFLAADGWTTSVKDLINRQVAWPISDLN